MSSDASLADYICECLNLSCLGGITIRKMFGEYGVYYKKKVIGFICDNELFIKQTNFGHEILSNPVLKPPYVGARPYFLIENYEDRELMQKLIFGSYDELPMQKSRRKKNAKIKKDAGRFPAAELPTLGFAALKARLD